MNKILQVGVIGASAGRGWARDSHVPAVQALAGLELAAVASGSQSKAEAAAKEFGAKAAYGDAKDLIQAPDIDLVVVAVKVPDHRELVLGALAAGKHVFCEWPLGRDLAEAEEMTAAQTTGLRTAIGLQARLNPATVRARDIIASGAIGRVLSARIYSTTVAFGPEVESALAFAESPGNGVTLVTIQGAHSVDLAVAILGPLAELSALTTIQFPEVAVGEEKAPRKRSIPDHFLMQARLASGGALVVEVAGGRPAGATPFRMEVTGEKSTLLLEGGAARGFQSGRLQLSLDGQPESVDEGETRGLPDAAANVAGVYAALREDVLHGGSTAPDFRHAVRLTRLMDALLSSAQSGTRERAAGWPGDDR